MSFATNLIRRDGRYFFRKRVPLHLFPNIRKREIKFSLNTANPKIAQLRLFHLQIHVQKFFRNLENGRGPKEAMTKLQEALETIRLLNEISEIKDKILEEEEKCSALKLEAEQKKANVREIKDLMAFIKKAKEQKEFMEDSTKRLKNLGNNLDDTFSSMQQKIKEGVSNQEMQQMLSDAARGIISKEAHELFSIKYAAFIEPMHGKHKKGYVRLHEKIGEFLIEVIGDKPIKDYSYDDISKLISTLQQYPVNSLQRFETESLLEAIELNKNEGLKTISDGTINSSYLPGLKKFFRLKYKRGIIPLDPMEENRATSSVKSFNQKKKARDPFSYNELNKMFNAPIYHGTKNHSNWHTSGKTQIRDHRFWCPLVCLFTGARENEIGQLLLGDIVEFNNMAHIRFKAVLKDIELEALGITREEFFELYPERSLKTENSDRLVPIHPRLVETGFLDFVNEELSYRKPYERIFARSWNLSKSDSTYSHNYSKQFSRWLTSLKVKRRENCFHSFRHSFTDEMRRAGFSDSLIERYLGHAQTSTKAIYGSGYLVPEESQRIVDIKFKEVDLSHIYFRKV